MKITLHKVRKWNTKRKLEELHWRIQELQQDDSKSFFKKQIDDLLLILDIWKRDVNETHETPKKKERKSKDQNIFEATV